MEKILENKLQELADYFDLSLEEVSSWKDRPLDIGDGWEFGFIALALEKGEVLHIVVINKDDKQLVKPSITTYLSASDLEILPSPLSYDEFNPELALEFKAYPVMALRYGGKVYKVIPEF